MDSLAHRLATIVTTTIKVGDGTVVLLKVSLRDIIISFYNYFIFLGLQDVVSSPEFSTQRSYDNFNNEGKSYCVQCNSLP